MSGRVTRLHPRLCEKYEQVFAQAQAVALEDYAGCSPAELAGLMASLREQDNGELSPGERGWVHGEQAAIAQLLGHGRESACR